MATTLTFEVGRRPGIVCRQRAIRKHTPDWTGAQRAALSDLVHSRGGPSASGAGNNRGRFEFVWFAVLALVFLLSGRMLFEGLRSIHSADAMHTVKVAEPHVDVTITRLAPPTEALRAAAPTHSSVAVSRTM
ncbi:MAG TPA: hypothetical protein VGK44_10440 [Casimicrobiaceae bacterium]|jgi:hypothetical protein